MEGRDLNSITRKGKRDTERRKRERRERLWVKSGDGYRRERSVRSKMGQRERERERERERV